MRGQNFANGLSTRLKGLLLLGTMLASAPVWAATAAAADDQPQAAAATATDASQGVQEIIVTAQKRSQSQQTVPIAVTAINADALKTARVTSVLDLSGLVPGLTVRPGAGSIGLPNFNMRGIQSAGSIPGSDKEISVYLDGVPIGAPRGSTLDLADIERIEVLRGPQGTLFGRNSTAGAVGIYTRNPTGVFGGEQDVSAGNRHYIRSRTTVELPKIGPFSAYVTYVKEKKDGDVRNTGAGTTWDRDAALSGIGKLVSPSTLGAKDADTVFVALRAEISPNADLVYKFSYYNNDFTPNAQAAIVINTASPLLGPLLASTAADGGAVLDSSFKRPDATNNRFTVPGNAHSQTHSLTFNWKPDEAFSVKAVAGYQKNYIFSAGQTTGIGEAVFGPTSVVPYATLIAASTVPGFFGLSPAAQGAVIGGIATSLTPAIGSPFCGICSNAYTQYHQYSGELQANYTSSLLTITAGGIYFKSSEATGGPPDSPAAYSFAILPADGNLPLGNVGLDRHSNISYAGYVQGELHLTKQLNVIGGLRVTHDDKTSSYTSGGAIVGGTLVGTMTTDGAYKNTRSSYSVGVDYKPIDRVLFYAKYSTGFVSGGTVADVPYAAETVSSYEAGIKADLFNRILRINLAAFRANYSNLQDAQSGATIGRNDLAVIILQAGDQRATGIEGEVTLAPTRGLTFNSSFGYTNFKATSLTPIFAAAFGVTNPADAVFDPQPNWTTRFAGEYITPQLFETGGRVAVHVDANWQSSTPAYSVNNPALIPSAILPYSRVPAYWVVNGRLALRELKAGSGHVEIAAWIRNAFDNRSPSYATVYGTFVSATDFIPARSFGADVSFKF